MLTNYGQENEIVVFDQNSNISFLGCGMALWIGEQIAGPEGLFYSNKEELENWELQFIWSHLLQTLTMMLKQLLRL